MSKSTPVIDINGNQYDAVTGQLIGVVEKISRQVKKPSGGGSIDGFARRSSVVAQTVHRKAQRSHTLMRTAVKRPAKTSEPAVSNHTGKGRDSGVDPLRFSRSQSVPKSMKVSHFGHPGQKAEVKKSGGASVKGEVLDSGRGQSGKSQSLAAAKPAPSLISSASHQQLERLLDLALFQADSHKQELGQSKRPSFFRRFKSLPNWRGVTAALAVILLLSAFYAWQRVPQVALKVAAARAHVGASMPAYVPRGYSFTEPIKYSDGSVTIKFKSAQKPNQSFEVTQKISNMNSTSFAASMLPHSAQVQTSQLKGTTIYVYGQSNHAAWVSHGIAYTIKDSADLNTDQLLKIADSL